MSYIDTVDNKIRKCFSIFEPNFPEWLNEYIETDAMQKQQYISVTCGKVYSNLFDIGDYNSLDHSIGVALIVWHFTHDKAQTLSGLFHDIATPVFKHCVDFLNGDWMTQESTEDLTKEIIKSSDEIMRLLNRDNIKLEDVCDYHMYPIADNDTPRLSADRLEYSLTNGSFIYPLVSLDEIKTIYNDIEIQINEDGIEELGFKTKKIARDFMKLTSKLSVLYRDHETRFFMQAIADLIKKVNEENIITLNDFYELKEKDVMNILKESKYKDVFNKLLEINKINISKEKPNGIYNVNHGAKVRYIDPLFNGKRMTEECKIAKRMIEKNLSYDMDYYLFVDKDFNVLI